MIRTTTALLAAVGLTVVLVACSDHVAKSDTCADTPSAKGCKKSDTASAASAYTQAPTTPIPTPAPAAPAAAADAGADAARPLPKPQVPPASAACKDLTRCCGQVKDSLERAACTAIAVQQKSSLCANAVIAYQVFGGCGHSPLSLPDIFKSDKTPNTSKDCTYLERACAADPTACDAAYQCYGVSAGGTETTADPCDSTPDPYCCRYPNTFDCGGSPPLATDPCDTAADPYCCRYPNSFDCGGGTPPVDPCDSAPDPTCCRNPNSFDCGGGSPPPPPPSDPCDFDPDPYCCRNPASFDCSGGF